MIYPPWNSKKVLNIGHPKRKQSYWNHPFSGSMLVFGGVCRMIPFQQVYDLQENITINQFWKSLWKKLIPFPSSQWKEFPIKEKLGGGFKYFLFSPLFGEDFQFDEHIFQMGWFNHQSEKGIPMANSNWGDFPPKIFHRNSQCQSWLQFEGVTV